MGDSYLVDYVKEGKVRSLHIGVSSVLYWRDKCGVAVNLNHDHDVLVASLRMEGEVPSLI